MKLSPNQMAALRAVCDALLPGFGGDDYARRTASDLKVAERVLELVGSLGNPQQADFQQLMLLLASPAVGLTFGGRLAPAQKMRREELEKMLQSWSGSRFEKLRFGFNGLKKMACLVYYGDSPDGQSNPNFGAVGYPGPLEMPENLPRFEFPKTQILPENGLIDCEVLVIGSGAGGGVSAAFLAEKGRDVVVIEKGGRPDFSKTAYRELASFEKMYEQKGLLTNQNGAVSLLAGSVLGGGTTVNWAGSFRTPDFVLDEWANGHGNPDFLGKMLAEHFDFLEKRMSVRPAERHNPQNQSLWDGAETLGWKVKPVPVNQSRPSAMDDTTYWKSMGYSPLGDSMGMKQGTAATFLKDAAGHGARIFTDVFLEKITIENGHATGATGTATLPDGSTKKVQVRAKKVVVAAGAIHTPALLLRSGLRHPQLGKNLFLHPTTVVPGVFSAPSDPWHGHMMSAVCDEWVKMTGNFGAKFETAPAHPGLLASALPWESGEAFKNEMRRLRFMRNIVVLVRDKFGGSVRVGRDGSPEISYKLSDFDRAHFIRGQQEAVRLHAAAGCEEAMILHNQPLRFISNRDDLNHFLPKIAQLRFEPNRFGLFSAHQMGTARMGGMAKMHPVLPTGETREVRGLFVADASLFPSASGANPMLSIMALARFVASGI